MDGIKNGSGLCETHSFSNSIASSYPSSVDEPNLHLVFLTHFSEFFCVNEWVKWEESLSEAGREGRDWLSHTLFSSSNLGSVSRDEMIHGLLAVQLGNWWHDTEGITCEEDHIFGMSTDGW